MWFNNVTIKEVRQSNGWTVVYAETINGHKVRGITKFEMKNAVVNAQVNMKIERKENATYVNAVIAREA